MRNRRDFLKMCLVSGSALVVPPDWLSTVRPFLEMPAAGNNDDPWRGLAKVLARIRPPVFPNRDFEITKFGAAADGKFDCTEAFRKAITACSAAGGGRVIVPSGEFNTGAIHLKSNVNLHVSSGATVRFTRDTQKYPLVFTRWEGVELMNYSPFIYAFEQENIAITGSGWIDGNADCEHWWPWKGRADCGWNKGDANQDQDRNALFAMAEQGVPVKDRIFGQGHYLRPQFIQPYQCRNVLIEGVTLVGSPMWHVHPVLCRNVIVQGLTISSPGPNTDGCDPESCTDVLIKDVSFNTGDDCIAIKAGRNADGRRLSAPSRNIVIQGCRMKDGHGGVTIGSEISGGVRDVFAENCEMDSPHLDYAVRIKNNAMRGGVLEDIYVRNIRVGEIAKAALSIDFFYEEGEKGAFTPVVRTVDIRNLRGKRTPCALYLRGFKNAPIEDVRLADCDLEDVPQPNVIENTRNLELHNVRINGKLVKDPVKSPRENSSFLQSTSYQTSKEMRDVQ